MKKRNGILSKLVRRPKGRKSISEHNQSLEVISPVAIEYLKKYYFEQAENPYFVADQAIERLKEVLEKNISINQKSRQILAQAQELNHLVN
jgi:phage terminase small subunit